MPLQFMSRLKQKSFSNNLTLNLKFNSISIHIIGYFYTSCCVFLHKEVKSTQFVPHNSRFQIKLQISLQISALFPAINTYYIPQDILKNRGADKSLARPGRKQSTETEDFDVHISYLQS